MSIEKYLDYTFASSSGLTPEFADFAKRFRAGIRKDCESNGIKLVAFNRGHFYVSGFVQNPRTQKYAYFSVPDVRYSPREWHQSVLVRTAQGPKDYTGGSNGYVPLPLLASTLARLTI
jgi:hypothetical protein